MKKLVMIKIPLIMLAVFMSFITTVNAQMVNDTMTSII